ncbi:hypothetical protein [Kitasatospora cathayae]|uniref:Lipoprotein n=1 Tax=Kitasatospora cathayae TaxID=3004092 RepID=A0ABY7QDH6_9ACTN|nr:hypothetical protein [Kitasatospora sp. HUAS 3-15]WBP90751.1 hypothetical protein O1G21_36050 [Kitasatospora sp. HUAS 3-15]
MPFSTTRRAPAVRTLAGTVLAAALLVSAATACSSSSDAPGTAAPTTTIAATPTPGASTAPSATATPPASPGTHGTTASATPTGSHRSTPPASSGKGTKSQPLPDGSKVEIQQLGDQHYAARIVHDGQVLGTVEANGHDAGVDANDMFVVLALDGTVHAWMDGSHQGPGTFELAGGWTAKVTKVGELHYRADIIGNDNAVMGTMEANQHDDGLDANGVYIVLGAGGEISAHA